MKATGIVRRIDDLGRVVIPKEIRRTMRIRESEPLEIFTGREGEIILKKYSPISEMTEVAKHYVDSLSQVCGRIVMVADRDKIIAAGGGGTVPGVRRGLPPSAAQVACGGAFFPHGVRARLRPSRRQKAQAV